MQKLDTELRRKQQAIQLVLGERPAPKPAWLLAYLGQVVPADLVVTNFTVKREDDYYRVRSPAPPSRRSRRQTPCRSAESVARLKAQLSGSPFNMRMLETNDFVAMAAKAPRPRPAWRASRSSDWLNSVTTAVAARVDRSPPQKEEVKQFRIEGVLR